MEPIHQSELTVYTFGRWETEEGKEPWLWLYFADLPTEQHAKDAANKWNAIWDTNIEYQIFREVRTRALFPVDS